MAQRLLDLYDIADGDSISVCWFPMEAAESLSIRSEDGICAIAIDPQRLRGLADEKVKLAHELGHCETGSFYNRFAALDVRQKHEHRADRWAIQKLIPQDALEEAIRCGRRELWELAEHFDVTEDLVRKTETGEHYHYSSTCNGGTYYEATLAEAMGRGLTPCDKCVLTGTNDPSSSGGQPAATSPGNGNADNFNTYDNEHQQETTASYVLNTNTMKIHYPSCSQVKKIAPQNYATSNATEAELLAQGYTTCGVCH